MTNCSERFHVSETDSTKQIELIGDRIPDYLPRPLALVYVSGFFEVAGGVGVAVPRLRRAAGWGLIALLVAVFPANVHMFVNADDLPPVVLAAKRGK